MEQESRVISFYRKTAANYDKEYETPLFQEVYDKITWHHIEPYLPRKGTIFDAGGGTGKWSIPIAKKGLNVVLYDLSKDMLKVAWKKIKQEKLQDLIFLIQGDICHIPLQDDSFKFVLAEGDPISYCSNPGKAVNELSRVLKPDCSMAAGVDSLFVTLRRMLNSEQVNLDEVRKVIREKRVYAKDWGFDYWAFTPMDLRRLFTKCRLGIVKIAGKPIMYQGKPETDFLFQDEEKTKKLLEIELKFCDNPDIVGYGGHLHIVARKSAKREHRKDE